MADIGIGPFTAPEWITVCVNCQIVVPPECNRCPNERDHLIAAHPLRAYRLEHGIPDRDGDSRRMAAAHLEAARGSLDAARRALNA